MGASGASGIGGAGGGNTRVGQPAEPPSATMTAPAAQEGGRPGAAKRSSRSALPKGAPAGPTADGVPDGAKDAKPVHTKFTDPDTGKPPHRVTFPVPRPAAGQGAVGSTQDRGRDRAALNDLAAQCYGDANLKVDKITMGTLAQVLAAQYSTDPEVRGRSANVCDALNFALTGIQPGSTADVSGANLDRIRDIR